MNFGKRIFSGVLALCMAGTSLAAGAFTKQTIASAAADYSMNSGKATVEYLDRGISAIDTGKGIMVSWRFNANDATNTTFRLYRDNTLIYTSDPGKATSYIDKDGNVKSNYRVETVVGGKVIQTDTCNLKSSAGNSWIDLAMDPPKAQTSGVTYRPNDMAPGDVDGDGQYELFVKWDPSNSKDNSQKGKTDKVYIDCYKLNGKRLWRIDLGVNIRAGAHYTQMNVADFDLDGKAELMCKTADGTVDGQGNVIGDKSKDYRNSSGYVLSGPEYYTLFDGATGKALDTVNYEYPRGTVKSWGDSYGNRCDRFVSAVAYLDGVRPYAISERGYYTRMTMVAYGVKNKKIYKKWGFDTGNSSSAKGYGCGNHNTMCADVDADGKEEIITGANCIDDDGTLKWTLGTGHGDALHLGDFVPSHEGLELWTVHEDKGKGGINYGATLVSCKDGKRMFHVNGSADTGRGAADNVWSGHKGAEFWSSDTYDVYDENGKKLNMNRPSVNSFIYWDGDLERELLDGGNSTDTASAKIDKVTADGKISRLFTSTDTYTNNTTKGNACLSADLFGDWREELILRRSDNKGVRIYCTPIATDYRITTLMHDVQYRTQVAGENAAYNQPPHPSFYLGSDADLPARPNVTVLGKGNITPEPIEEQLTPATLKEGGFYMIKNKNSGLYMEIEGASTKAGANVQQWGAEGASAHNTWRAISAGDGYYYLQAEVGDKTMVLDIAGRKADNATNIDIYPYKAADNQKFMFTDNGDGSYKIRTKITDGKSAVEIANGSTSSGANVQQYEVNGATCQDWVLEEVGTISDSLDEGNLYMFQNLNSSLYLEIKDGKAEAGANAQQWDANGSGENKSGDWNTFNIKSFGGGLYYINSQLAGGSAFGLKSTSDADGGNIELSAISNKDSALLFRFVKNPDGTYYILPRTMRDKGAVEISNAATTAGANVGQWTINGNNCQKWKVVSIAKPVVTTATAAPIVTTTAKPVITTTTAAPIVTTTAKPVVTTTTQAPIVTTTVKPVVTTITQAPIITTTKAPVISTTVITTTNTIITTATPDSSKGDEDHIIYGDADNNGVVSIADAVCLNRYIAGSIQLSPAGIKNCDLYKIEGQTEIVINSNDSEILLKYLVQSVSKTDLPIIVSLAQ